jgi:hypothetical protein
MRTVCVSYQDLVFRFVYDPIVNTFCWLTSLYPAGMESIDFGELSGEEETCWAGTDDQDIHCGVAHGELCGRLNVVVS